MGRHGHSRALLFLSEVVAWDVRHHCSSINMMLAHLSNVSQLFVSSSEFSPPKGSIKSRLRPYWGMSFTEIALEIWDYSRTYFQIGIEMLRNMRLLLTSSTGVYAEDDAGGLTLAARSTKNGRNKRRRRFNEPSCSSMPELEEAPIDDANGGEIKAEYASEPIKSLQTKPIENEKEKALPAPRPKKRDEIEPAFLKEEDYPPGWLVYHPVLGVVPKTEADRYREEEELRTRNGIGTIMPSTPAIVAS